MIWLWSHVLKKHTHTCNRVMSVYRPFSPFHKFFFLKRVYSLRCDTVGFNFITKLLYKIIINSIKRYKNKLKKEMQKKTNPGFSVMYNSHTA